LLKKNKKLGRSFSQLSKVAQNNKRKLFIKNEYVLNELKIANEQLDELIRVDKGESQAYLNLQNRNLNPEIQLSSVNHFIKRTKQKYALNENINKLMLEKDSLQKKLNVEQLKVNLLDSKIEQIRLDAKEIMSHKLDQLCDEVIALKKRVKI